MATKDIIQAAAGVGGGGSPLYVEDVFSTYLYTGNGSTQTIGNGIALEDGATTPGWIATLGGAAGEQFENIITDSSGNVYAVGRSASVGQGSNDLLIAKYDSSGAIQWQRTLGGSVNEVGWDIALDSSGNVYVVGQTNSAGQGSIDALIAKYDSSGTIQWQRTLGGSSNDYFYGIAVDSSGNIYVTGQTTSAGQGSNDLLIVKYDSSGAIQWQRTLGGASSEHGWDITLDSSGNVYVTGRSSSAGQAGYDALIVKYDSSGAIQWQRTLGGADNDYGYGIAVDSSGNVYCVGFTESTGAGGADPLIAKYDSSGTIQWQRTLGDTSGDLGFDIALDSSGNVYLAGYTQSTGAGNNDALIAKYDSSGTIQWQRTLGGTLNDAAYGITVDSSGNVYVAGNATINASSATDALIAKLPADGSGVGGYGLLTYAASSLTDASSSLTSATSSLTDAASSLTDAASSLTDAASSLTSSVTDVPEVVGKGGLVWIKSRSNSISHCFFDTSRGVSNYLNSNTTAPASQNTGFGVTSFSSSGFSVVDNANGDYGVNGSGGTYGGNYVSWTFRKAPKFFDVVFWTGNGVAGRTVAHNLGSVPGCIMVKRTDTTGDWVVWHRSLDNSGSFYEELALNTTAVATTTGGRFPATEPTSTEFYVNQYNPVNASGGTYVAYLFAHDAGGFGEDGTENVISCGSYTTDGSGNATVNLGWEPQWIITKSTTRANVWVLNDSMRGMTADKSDARLDANSSIAELTLSPWIGPTATGFSFSNSGWASASFIYIAIRRGPMKVPESGTEVFSVSSFTALEPAFQTSHVVDASFYKSTDWQISSRMQGAVTMQSNTTAAESSQGPWKWDYNNGWRLGAGSAYPTYYSWMFRRAPGFFDVVAYTGDGVVGHTVSHNLGVAPEFIITKNRTASAIWNTYYVGLSAWTALNTSNASVIPSTAFSDFTATSFDVNSAASGYNGSGQKYIAYLFASCPGVSKVGSYTGTETTQQIDCGFSSGARFILIKRTDNTGNWYVWDSTRGIVAGNDPYVLLNSSATDVTNTDYIDPYSAGFEISSTAPAAINASGGSFIFLAIA